MCGMAFHGEETRLNGVGSRSHQLGTVPGLEPCPGSGLQGGAWPCLPPAPAPQDSQSHSLDPEGEEYGCGWPCKAGS